MDSLLQVGSGGPVRGPGLDWGFIPLTCRAGDREMAVRKRNGKDERLGLVLSRGTLLYRGTGGPSRCGGSD